MEIDGELLTNIFLLVSNRDSNQSTDVQSTDHERILLSLAEWNSMFFGFLQIGELDIALRSIQSYAYRSIGGRTITRSRGHCDLVFTEDAVRDGFRLLHLRRRGICSVLCPSFDPYNRCRFRLSIFRDHLWFLNWRNIVGRPYVRYWDTDRAGHRLCIPLLSRVSQEE